MFPDYKNESTEKLKREIENYQDTNSLAERLEKAQQSMDKMIKGLIYYNEKKKHKKYID